MRDFLKDCMKKLKVWTGLNQAQNMSNEELIELLDVLEMTCNQYKLIPDDEKRKVILHQLVNDQDFKGFNAAVLHRWFQKHMASNTMLYAQKSNEGAYDEARSKKNSAFFKKQLELKRANNPDYNPKQEFRKMKVEFNSDKK